MTEYSAQESAQRAVRHDGVVSLILSGPRPIPKSAAEVFEAARAAQFVDDGALTNEYEGGSIEYVPTALSSNAVAETLMEGRLLFRFTIVGDPPIELSHLTAGTYYTYVDFVEGPDLDEGRWIARIIDENGKVAGIVPGVEVKQVVSFHIDERERDAHARPEIHTHGLGVGEVAEALMADTKFKPPKSTGAWTVTWGDWTPHGAGCQRTFYCVPNVALAFE